MSDLRSWWRVQQEGAQWPPLARYAAAVALTALGTGLIGVLNSGWWIFRSVTITNPGVPFVAVVALVALLLGFGPGIVAAALSTGALIVFFWPSDWLGLAAVYVVTTAVVLAIAQAQRRAQARAVQAQTAYRAIIAGMEDAVMVVDAAGRPTDANDAAVAMLGARDHADALAHIGRLKADGTPATDEYALLRRVLAGEPAARGNVTIPDGAAGPRTVSAVASPLRGAGGRVIGAVSVSRDVTERERLLAAIEEERRYTRLILDTMPLAIGVVRPDDLTVTSANPVFLAYVSDLAGRTFHAGMGLLAALPGLAESAFVRDIRRAAAEGRAVSATGYRAVAPAGRVYDWTMQPLRRAGGETATLVTFADVTERMAAGAERERLLAELAATFTAMVDGISVYDAEGDIVRRNPAYSDILGFTPEDAPLRLVDESAALHPHTPEGVPLPQEQMHAARALRGETVRGEVVRVRDGQGRQRFLRQSASPIRAADGTVTGAVVVFSDVTEARAQEQRLRMLTRLAAQRASQLEAVIGALAEGLLLADTTGTIVQSNAALRRVFALDDDAPLPLLHEFGVRFTIRTPAGTPVPPEERAGTAALRGAARTEQLRRFTNGRGEARWLSVNATPVRVDGGAVTGVAMTLRDVTERLEHEHAIAAHASEWAAVFAALTEGVIFSDTEGRVLRHNEAARRVLGLGADAPVPDLEEWVARFTMGAADGAAIPREERAWRRAVAGETLVDQPRHFIGADGVERWMSVSAAPVRDAGGAITGMAMTLRDVTQQWEREREREALLGLVEERRRFAQAIFDTVPVGLAVLDAETLTFDAANPAYLAALPEPYRTRGVNGVSIARLFPHLVADGQAERLRAICAGGPPLTRAATPARHPERGETFFNEMVVALPSVSGVCTHALSLIVDITEQVQAQQRIAALAQAASERAAQTDALFAALTEGLMLIDAAGNVTRANAAAARLLALGDEPLTTMAAFVERFAVRQADGAPIAPEATITARVLAGETVTNQLRRFRNGRGEERWMSVSASPVRGAAGEIVGVARTFRDVTDERAASEERERLLVALEQRERFTQAIFDAVPVGLMVVGVEDGLVREANNAYARFIDATYTGADLVGRQAALLQPTGATTPLPAGAVEQYRAGLQALAASRESAAVHEFPYPDYPGRGQTYWDLTGVPLVEADGAVRDVLVVTVDTTEQTMNRRRVEELAQSAAQRAAELETIITNMPDGVIIASPRGEVRLMNTTARAMVGTPLAPDAPPAEQVATYAIRWPDGTPIPPERIPVARAAGGETFTDVEILVRAERGDLFLLCRGAPIRDAAGEITGAVVVFSDITGRKRAEQERERLLREVEAQRNLAQSVIENAPAGIVVFGTDAAFTVRAANAQYGALLDAPWRARSIVGCGVREILPEPGAAEIVEIFRRVAASGEMFAVREYQFAGFARGDAYFDWSLVPLREAGDGAITGLLALASEVTDRVLSQQRIEELADAAAQRAAELETVIASVPVGIIIHARDGAVVQINATGRAITGADLSPDDDLAAIAATYEVRYPNGTPIPYDDLPAVRALRGETVTGYEFLSNARGGIHLLSGAAPIRDAAGEITGAVFSFSDITAIKQLERMKDEFVSIAAHELRTPLTAIKGYTELLERRLRHQPERERDRQTLAVIRKQADRLARLVNEMLDVSRIEVGRLTLNREPFDLAALAREVLANLRVSAEAHRLTLETEGDLIVEADAARIEQVLINLVTNAITYSPEGGEVAVRLWRAGDDVRISVRDEGIGIAPEEMPHLFERFYRAPKSGVTRFGGMGLGLYISNEIVARHGGTIRVESAVGAGSTFTVSLPRGEKER